MEGLSVRLIGRIARIMRSPAELRTCGSARTTATANFTGPFMRFGRWQVVYQSAEPQKISVDAINGFARYSARGRLLCPCYTAELQYATGCPIRLSPQRATAKGRQPRDPLLCDVKSTGDPKPPASTRARRNARRQAPPQRWLDGFGSAQ